MPYAILRFQKKKSGGVTASYAHNERKKETYKSNPDIDTSRKEENYHLVLPKQTYLRETKRLITAAGCKARSNSTVMVETLITASPEFMNALPPPEQREYFKRALKFMSDKIGNRFKTQCKKSLPARIRKSSPHSKKPMMPPTNCAVMQTILTILSEDCRLKCVCDFLRNRKKWR